MPAKRRATRDGLPVADYDLKMLSIAGSVHDGIQRHVRHLAVRHYAESTITKRQDVLLQWSAWCIDRGLVLLKDIERRHLERYQSFLFAYRKPNGRPLAVRTQTQRLIALRQLFSWAVKQHLVPANPAADLDLPRDIRTLPVHLTSDELQRVLAAPDTADNQGLRDRAILELLYSTGMRRSEVSRLAIEDIDPLAGLVLVRQGKGRKDRMIPIGQRALDWIDHYFTHTRASWCLDVSERTVFVQPDGCAITPGQISALVHRHLRTAEITKQGCCHLFRHTFATQLLSAGCDMRYIQDMLGHAHLHTTAHYAQVTVNQLKAMHAAFHPAETAAKASEAPNKPQ